MRPRSIWILVGLALAAFVAVYLTRAPRPVRLPQQGPEGPVWLFDFGPELAEPFPGFARVSGQTRYEATRGYGWLDVEGELESGSFHDPSLHWEGARNLNLVERPGPDPLAATFATGPAVFELDLPPGRYDVWVLTGDWGLLEYIPHEAYQIVVEGRAVDLPGLSEEEFYRRIETPGPDDTITDEEAYERYVAPRFRWEKVSADVEDSGLSVQVAAPARSRALLDKLGYYPWADIKYGPPERFAGALNAMVVTPSDPRSDDRIQRFETERRDIFRDQHPRVGPSRSTTKLEAPDLERGFNLFSVTTLDTIEPETTREHEEVSIALRATPGEYVPITFAMRPHRDVGEVRLVATHLADPTGALLDGATIEIGAVRHAARKSADPDEAGWEPGPGVIVPGDRHTLAPQVTKQFWLTLHVPRDSDPGMYMGTIEIQPERGAPARVELALEVLPFPLRRPTHIATGLTYFVPITYAYHDEERFWKRIRADFDDMRRHNMTTVQLTGAGLGNYDGLDQLFSIYRDADFEQPVYFLEAFTAIEYVHEAYGFEEGTEPFYERYVAIIAALMEEARKRDWPPLIINFGDEFTNSAREEFGAELARRLRSIPGIVTAADANGYRELALIAPHVSILAFNRGWSGPNGVNGDRRLVNAETVALVRESGAHPWLVNVGKDRFSNGVYLWKMIRQGVRGRLEWIYSDYHADPQNPFDGIGLRAAPLSVAGPSHTTLATLDYERMRQGLDDLAYLYTLEELARSAASGPRRERARALVEQIDAAIHDDLEIHRVNVGEPWSVEQYRDLRDAVIEAILGLR